MLATISAPVPCRHGPMRRCSSCPASRPTWTSGLLASHSKSTITVPQVVVDLVAQLELQPEQVVSATARLVEMIEDDPPAAQEIRTAGGVRQAVFLLKLSQAAGDQGIASAASRLLLHLAQDEINQDEICSLEGIPCLVDVVLSFARHEEDSPRSRSRSSRRELFERTEAVCSAAEALGLLAGRHAGDIARAGGVEVSSRLSNLSEPTVAPPGLQLLSPRQPPVWVHTWHASPSRRFCSRSSAEVTPRVSRWWWRSRCLACARRRTHAARRTRRTFPHRHRPLLLTDETWCGTRMRFC